MILKPNLEESRKDMNARTPKMTKIKKATLLNSRDSNTKIKLKVHNMIKMNDNTADPNFNMKFALKVILLITVDLKEFKKC